MDFPITMHYSRVRQLMRMIPGQETPHVITMPGPEVRELRGKLIMEEVFETLVRGLGLNIYVKEDVARNLNSRPIEFEDLEIVARANEPYHPGPDMVEIADGCADISVVTTGTLVACGVPDSGLLALVDENNLAKFGPGSYLREDGKWIKPPDHKAPDIGAYLSGLGWRS